jgi:hypothetical protein
MRFFNKHQIFYSCKTLTTHMLLMDASTKMYITNQSRENSAYEDVQRG